MSNDEVTQPLTPRTFPRYVIKTYAEEGGVVYVYDTWANVGVRAFGPRSGDPQESAEAVAANLNSTGALEFIQSLSRHIVGMCDLVGGGGGSGRR